MHSASSPGEWRVLSGHWVTGSSSDHLIAASVSREENALGEAPVFMGGSWVCLGVSEGHPRATQPVASPAVK